ncbi:MAG: AMP-dependent synthetase/ligase [Deltaproteobacteria bacterium]
MQSVAFYQVRPIESLKDLLEQSCRLFKQNKAFAFKKKGIDEIQSVSYGDFKSDVDAFGTALINLGLKDARIAILAENRYEWAVSYFAAAGGTGVVVPIDKALPFHELENVIHTSEADAIIYSGKLEESIKQLSNTCPTIKHFIGIDREKAEGSLLSYNELIRKGRKLLKSGDKTFTSAKIDSEKMGIMLFTSGTSEFAKAVMLSHKNLCADLMSVMSVVKSHEDDVFLSFLPLHHTYEFTCGLLSALYGGACIAFCEGLKHIAKNLKDFKATMMCSVPLLYENMYKKAMEQISKQRGAITKMNIAIKFSNFCRKYLNINPTKKLFKQIHDVFGGHVRIFLSGAAAIDPGVAKWFNDIGIKLLQGYGLTECSPLVTGNNDRQQKNDSPGVPLPNVEVKIDSPNEEGIGEIVTKGPNVMLGYYKNEEATTKVLKDGWFYTGDLGYFDKDGFLHITGRKKNVIVLKNGKNVFPEELETILNKSPYIKESMVWEKHEDNGDVKLCATVVVNNDYIENKFSSKLLTEEELHSLIEHEIKEVNKKMPIYKYIREFTIKQTDFIKTTTQKIKRYMEKVNK